jgi:hypothetical protein
MAVSGALALICCAGAIGSMADDDDPMSPSDFATEVERTAEATPAERETTASPEPTEAATTETVEAEEEEEEAPAEVYYENCDAARDAGAAPVYEDEEGYGSHLDSDGDGVGCEDSSGGGGSGGGGNDDDDDDGGSVYYENCDAVRDAGADPIYAGDPGYGSHLDRDGDGVGCE